jgi:alpha-ketoglutarate-dependent 2,4-dichlorophenoxyacetate dioxygenase
MAAAYDTLPVERLSELDGFVVEHSLAHSRTLIDLNMSDTFKDEVPPVGQALIRRIPETGRNTLYLGYHASHVVGWPVDRGRVLVNALNQWITQPQFTFEHRWAENDLVMWDNRCCLHCARPFGRSKYKRVMHRATVAGVGRTA